MINLIDKLERCAISKAYRDTIAWEVVVEDVKNLYYENEKLKNRNTQLEDFCQEFVYGEENPEYYKTMNQQLDEIKQELKFERNSVDYCKSINHCHDPITQEMYWVCEETQKQRKVKL